jgi:YidC/Oxa1 family membrane protein insertase
MAMTVRDPNSPPDPQQRMMNNMMQFMPLYIIFISANFPAGVVIYWLFSNVISVVQQYFITGWGSLPSFPGFGWLPKKPHVVPEPPPPPPALPEGVAPARKGLMSRMMAKAIEAQEAQKAVQSGSTATALAATGEVERVKRKGSETQIRPVRPEPAPRVVPSTSMKYASDLKRRASVEVGVEGISGINGGNGADHTGGIPSPSSASHLPRKRKNRK